MAHSRNASKTFSMRIPIPPKRKGKTWARPLECESTPFLSWNHLTRLTAIGPSCLFLATRTYQRSVFIHPLSPCAVLTTIPLQYHQLVPEPTQSRQTSQRRRIHYAPLPPAILCPIPTCILSPIVATPPTRTPSPANNDPRCPRFCIHWSSPGQVEWHPPIKISP